MKIINILIIINIIAFLITSVDKLLAILNKRRISEKTIIIISFIGGSLGTAISMIIFHHKTKKTKFKVFIPLALILNILIIVYLLKLKLLI